jgi:serine/threonine protein kinase/tetratricopeptide (TPR) repeat protein
MKERDIFIAALTIAEPAARAAFLDAACADEAQKAHLKALLAAEPGLGTFLESPAAPRPVRDDVAEGPGSVVGPYTIVEEIGEGGMGVVFLAEQETPVRRRVALKVIKPGMDSRQVVARFEAERQALALMEHPSIARVLDAGATGSGRPYFVMELVRGVPITDYCDQNRLGAEPRLTLFTAVCHAIQHAHHKGVVHRDIKPSNVLVGRQDGQPVVKVIDFGIAKAIDRPLTERTLFTAQGQLVGTPSYMSPEQADPGGRDIDTRTDVYSLGVLLYELMTGTTPLDSDRLRAAGFAEMQRIIREETPPRPSARLSSLGDTATVLAGNRGTDVRHLARVLAGDLDWIAMKALEKDRDRRYATPGAFAEDVERYLRREAVLARAPSAMYRLKRFAWRNRGAVIAAAAVAMTLVVGSAVATWQAVVATRARRDALDAAEAARRAKETAEAREAETAAVLDFVQDRVFAAARPEGRPGGLGPEVTLRRALETALDHVDRSFAGRPLIEARLRGTLGNSFADLGEARIAAAQHERARAIYEGTFGRDHPDTLRSASDLANSYRGLGRYPEGLKLHDDTLARRKAVLGDEHPETLTSMNNVANLHDDLGHHREALELRERTLARRRAVFGPTHIDTISSMRNLANSYAAQGRDEDGMKLEEEALALAKRALGPDHPDTLMIRNNLALSYAALRRFDDALKLQQETLTISAAKLGPNHPDTLRRAINVAKALTDLERHDEAVALLRGTLDLLRINPGPDHPYTLQTMYNLANNLGSLKRYEEALKFHADALAGRRVKLGPGHTHTLYSMWGVATNLVKLGRGAEAVPVIDECLRLAAGQPKAALFSDVADLRLRHFAKANDPAGCRATAEIWEALRLDDARSLYAAACFRAVTAKVVRAADRSPARTKAPETEADLAMDRLRRAIASGFKDAELIARDKDLDVLRDRPDFQAIVDGLASRPK